jgi:hypothetical protein
MLSDIAAVVSGIPYFDYLRSLPPGAVVAELDLVVSEAVYALTSVAQLIAVIAAAVFFLRWFYSAYRNVEALAGHATKHDARWAIWGFFVPILWFFRPFQIMREIWDQTSRRWAAEPSRVTGRPIPADRVTLWWTLCVIVSLLNDIPAWLSFRAEGAAAVATATAWFVVTDALEIPAAVLAIMVVRGVTDLQEPLLDAVPQERLLGRL